MVFVSIRTEEQQYFHIFSVLAFTRPKVDPTKKSGKPIDEKIHVYSQKK